MSTHTPAFIVWNLGRWANDMWTRFGGHGVGVYLVGSAIHSPNAKDIDVSIVLPDDVFRDRYGMLEREWQEEETRMEEVEGGCKRGVYKVNEWCPAHVRWAREVGGIVRGLSKQTRDWGPPDLKVMSESWQAVCHKDKPRLRLDTVEEGA